MNVGYLHTKSVEISEVSEDGMFGAANLELDALPLVPWLPLGASLALRRTGSVGSGSMPTVDEGALGIWYTGRPHLALGLELERREGRIDTELRALQTMAWVNLRYSW